ncbi:hypothetical protein [Ectopseudomonas toyotomiensis]|uniref:hypothetical protein n=1 Tax=Ectopseudomonas toyotomiensis TaxID=554344 RepID=UPI003D0A24BE
MCLHAFLRLFLCGFEAPQRWRGVGVSVMTLLSADAQTRQRLHGLGNDMAHTDFLPASGFKYTEFFLGLYTVLDY